MQTRRRRLRLPRDPLAPRFEDEVPREDQAGAGPPPAPRRPPRHPSRWTVPVIVAAGAAILLVAYAVGHGSRSSTGTDGSGGVSHASDAQWELMLDRVHGHVNAYTDAVHAGNTQAMLDANTKIAGDCRESGGYQTGSTHAEQTVRKACQIAEFPLP